MLRHLVILAALFGILYLARLGAVGVVDFDEAVYAEISLAMDTSGDLLVPRRNGESFLEKPPLVYWTQVAGFRAFGRTALGARALNAVAGIAVVLLLYAFARGPLGARGAFLAAIVLGTSLEFAVLARITLTDMWLTLWFLIALGAFWNAVERDLGGRGGLGWFLLAAAASGLAMLTKGAIGILLPGAAAFVYLWMLRRLRILLRPAWTISGLMLAAGIGLAWYLLLGFTQPDGFAFMEELFWEHHVGRFLHPMQGHRGPFFFYLLVLVPGFLPWSPLVPLALRELAGAEAAPRRLLWLFLAFGAITFVFFSAAATKLPNYILPVFPALALAVGRFLDRAWDDPAQLGGRAWRWATGVGVGLFCALAAALVAAPFVLPEVPHWLGDRVHRAPGFQTPPEFGAWPYFSAFAAASAAAVIAGRRRRSIAAVFVALAGGMVALYLFTIFAIGPRVDAHFAAPLRRAARTAAAAASAGERVVLLGIKRAPSVVFYGGRYTRYVSVRNEGEIAALFTGTGAVVGIAPEGYLARVEEAGRVDVVSRELGYVVFRSAPNSTPSSRTEEEGTSSIDGKD